MLGHNFSSTFTTSTTEIGRQLPEILREPPLCTRVTLYCSNQLGTPQFSGSTASAAASLSDTQHVLIFTCMHCQVCTAVSIFPRSHVL